MARAPDCSSVERDIDRGVAGRIVAQRRHQLQNRGAGERAAFRCAGAHSRIIPLALEAGLRRKGGAKKIAIIAGSGRIGMSESRLTSLTIESPAARTIAVRAREGKSLSAKS